jgi:uncharacterized protein
MTTPIEAARQLLAQRFALVGVSRAEKDFSRALLAELVRRGLDVVPVNPAVREVAGLRCYPRLQDVAPPPAAAILLTAPPETERVVRDAHEAGLRRVWMHRGGGKGAASPAAIAFCQEHGIEVIGDLCPFMALPGAGFAHRLHAHFRRGRLHAPRG